MPTPAQNNAAMNIAMVLHDPSAGIGARKEVLKRLVSADADVQNIYLNKMIGKRENLKTLITSIKTGKTNIEDVQNIPTNGGGKKRRNKPKAKKRSKSKSKSRSRSRGRK